jgi:hypothetical protein
VTLTYLGWSGLKVMATASRTGTSRDQPRCAAMGKLRYLWQCPMLPFGDTAPLRDDPL